MNRDFEIIRELALRLKEISSAEEYNNKRNHWKAHNALHGEKAPLLWICPDSDGGWLDLVQEQELQTESPDLRVLERQIRQLIFHHEHFQDDFVVEPLVRFEMPGEYTGYTYADCRQTHAWGIEIQGLGVSNQAYHMNNWLDSEDNIERLLSHEVDFIPDTERISYLKELYEQAVDGIIKVDFIIPYVVLVQSLIIELVHLRGLSELMYDLYDNPELLHKILDHMSASKCRLLERLENNHCLFDNRTNIYTGSGGLGYLPSEPKDSEKVMLQDIWGFADSQEFSGVSPEMFQDFALQYQVRGLSRFGMACYGCCEPLDNKYEMIFDALPNLRRLSVSPWSNIELAAENIEQKAIYSWKPNPAYLCGDTVNEEALRRDMRRVKKAAIGKCYTEVILKDIRTCTSTGLERFAEIYHEELC